MSRVLHQSSRLADQLLAAADRGGVVEPRRVKQARFVVLSQLAMPAALVELGYLSNAGDRALLQDTANRRRLAAELVEGIVQWRRDHEALRQLAAAGGDGWSRQYRVRRGDSLLVAGPAPRHHRGRDRPAQRTGGCGPRGRAGAAAAAHGAGTMNRLGLKISCLVASTLIWVQVAATTDVEQAARLPLRVVGLADGLTIAGSDVPSTVSVRLRGSKLRLLTNRFFSRYVGEVRLNLAERGPGPAFSYQLADNDVVSELAVVRFQRDERIRLRIDEVVSRRLPVAVMLGGELPKGTAFLSEPRADPDSATVNGPSRFVPDAGAVATEPLALDRLQPGRTDNLSLRLRAPHDYVMVAPSQVKIHCAVATVEERTLANVPVIPLVDAGQPDVGVSPPVADVMVRGVADSVRALTEARLSVTVAVGDRPEGLYVLPGQVDCPPWLTLLGLSPSDFHVIVGNPPVGQPTRRDSSSRRPAAGGADG